ncbi:putative short-chain dehydrogenase [Actinoplanes missouriensis 431]|uniref:Putative short-chain dehydrogenase n=1 Tax=Actinoplanes missouriensis (strain ATCC 14538 / DSM 43046 / CBS 188.64 / JCM 3121 / NBRC 102363 / NCIMB 12654 / NRRL B-3342 / UNCC 431) TaxID=512565 RepID=I0H310_ACTM4|nr:glucose 1-dehydrogenase [Actinoplanes missouriensis]BAL87397.1 putative short-chain dehydrogenase [Actinoplanes missouriensis 431]
MGRLDGKVALITGGARGMGKAHARHFTTEGARVVIGDVLEEKGQRVAAEIGGVFVRHDVTSADDWAAAVAAATSAYGRIDVLVNNAGILRHAPVTEMDPDEFRHVLDVNLVGSWLGIRAVVPVMRDAGGGSIVNISSIEGIAGAAGLSAYSASKFGVRGLTRSAAQELGPVGIRVNSVHPGGVMTSMALAAAQTMTGVDGSGFLKALPIARFAEPVEISRLVAFLASDDASYTTGAEFLADGGLLSGPGY